jgi:hypothetical protein
MPIRTRNSVSAQQSQPKETCPRLARYNKCHALEQDPKRMPKETPNSPSTKNLTSPHLSHQAQHHLSVFSQQTPKLQHTSNRSLLRAQASQSFNPTPKDHHARPPMEVVDNSCRRVDGEEAESRGQEAVQSRGRPVRRPSSQEAVERGGRREKKPSREEAVQKRSRPEKRPSRKEASQRKVVKREVSVAGNSRREGHSS